MYVDMSRWNARDAIARADAVLALGFVAPRRSRSASASATRAKPRSEYSGQPSMGTVRHECGHALEVLLAGGTVQSIQVGANGGVCYYSNVPNNKRVFVCIAGAVAENPDRAMASVEASEDRKDLLCALRHVLPNLTDDQRMDYAYQFWDDVDRDIGVNHGFFMNLVTLVNDQRYVDGRDVHALWHSHQQERQSRSYY